jgi:hypothetical protein
MVDVGDTVYEIKTEFYTREGIWRLVPNCEYIRQLQPQQQQLSPQYQQGANLSLNGSINTGNQQGQNASGQSSTYNLNSNDPVKIGVIKYSKRTIFNQRQKKKAKIPQKKTIAKERFKCSNCNRSNLNEEDNISQNNIKSDESNKEHDDDEDVVFTKFINSDSDDSISTTISSSDDYDDADEEDNDDDYDDDDQSQRRISSHNENVFICKYCKHTLMKSESNCNISSNSLASLDLILFNYAREIYFYEF